MRNDKRFENETVAISKRTYYELLIAERLLPAMRRAGLSENKLSHLVARVLDDDRWLFGYGGPGALDADAFIDWLREYDQAKSGHIVERDFDPEITKPKFRRLTQAEFDALPNVDARLRYANALAAAEAEEQQQ